MPQSQDISPIQSAKSARPEAPTALVAHTPNGNNQWHLLADHLHGTAERAREFAAVIGPEAAQLAYYAGLWHDIGKSGPLFQQYLHNRARGIGKRGDGGDHKGAGALHALPTCEWLTFLIDGHHGGLPASRDLEGALKEWRTAPHVTDALETAQRELGSLLEHPPPIALPEFASRRAAKRSREFFLRMLFSCLVDADFLDTEAHANIEKMQARQPRTSIGLAELWEQLAAVQEARIAENLSSTVNDVRTQVYRAAIDCAPAMPGIFRLTAPTGSGKTRSSLAFGLRHALLHGLRRVIFAVPYITITDQTAADYRAIFSLWPDVVLEHHSAVVGNYSWHRLACENWDAPVIVTTTVQLFESLLGNRTTACRKLHNIVGSVVVLDEAQALPPGLLKPLLDVLRELVAHYRVTVVLCTATQPAFQVVPGFAELHAREIAPDQPLLFTRLRRVTWEWSKPGERATWQQAADSLRAEPRSLVIANTRRDALALLDALDEPDALHLSTLLCAAHRQAVLEEVKLRLKKQQHCRLVATQVVEAGVDFSFPLAMRALAPLDAIAQTAGRCNREGELAYGRVIIFDPAEGHMPSREYAIAIGHVRTMLAAGQVDLDDPASFERFFRLFYSGLDTDKPGVQAYRAVLNYPETARRARLIDEDTVSVVIRYRGPRGTNHTVDRLLHSLECLGRRSPEDQDPGLVRWLSRRLQPYLVQVRRPKLGTLMTDELVTQVVPGLELWEWHGSYHPIRGLTAIVSEPHESNGG